jgi:hypothetical protein
MLQRVGSLAITGPEAKSRDATWLNRPPVKIRAFSLIPGKSNARAAERKIQNATPKSQPGRVSINHLVFSILEAAFT